MFREIVAVYYKNRWKAVNTTCARNTELFNVQLHGAYIYHRVLSVKQHIFTYTSSFILENRKQRH